MSSQNVLHHTDEQLMRLADGETLPPESAALRGHLAECEFCRDRFSAFEGAGRMYLEYHRGTMKALDPAPPRPWEDLQPKLLEIAASGAVRRGVPPAWLAIAAALLIAAIVFYRFGRAPEVRAAELLRRAAAAPAADPARPIRIRAGARSLVRRAVMRKGESEPGASDLAAKFQAANYSWEDPLSARSFAAWRNRLSEKTDEVTMVHAPGDSADVYQIRTTTRSGPLTEATLTLRTGDLHAVRGSLRFHDGLVEMEEGTPEAVAPSFSRQPAGLEPHAPAPAAGPGEELAAIAALHRIGADLGEPVEVTRESTIVVVRGTGLSVQRREEVTEALAALPHVALRFEEPGSEPPDNAPGKRAAPPPQRNQAESRLADFGLSAEAVDHILDTGESLMARVYALRALSKRFPPGIEANLPSAARGTLAALVADHVAALGKHLAGLARALYPVLGRSPPALAETPVDWQSAARSLFTAAQSADQLLNRVFAGGEFPARAPELNAAVARVGAELAAWPGVRR